MQSLYLKIKALNTNWNVLYEEDKGVIKICQGEEIIFRLYKNVNDSYTYFLLGKGTVSSPVGEYFTLDFLSKVMK